MHDQAGKFRPYFGGVDSKVAKKKGVEGQKVEEGGNCVEVLCGTVRECTPWDLWR